MRKDHRVVTAIADVKSVATMTNQNDVARTKYPGRGCAHVNPRSRRWVPLVYRRPQARVLVRPARIIPLTFLHKRRREKDVTLT